MPCPLPGGGAGTLAPVGDDGRVSEKAALRGRVSIRVRPGASRAAVGGSYDGRLVVAVSARAVDGAATEAALKAVADAFGVRRRHVALVTGTTARDKVVEVDLPADVVATRLATLLAT